tara:strand:- start:2758 stop:3603 length:846 start_codon:yes stop_codon:yes gene_type:complete
MHQGVHVSNLFPFQKFVCLLIFLSAWTPVIGQELDLSPESDGEVEELYDRLDQQVEDQNRVNTKKAQENSSKKVEEVQNLSDLARLQAFEDVAVIQKRFLPKTGRFELSALGFTNLNNPFFNNLGGGFKLGYHFSENWGASLVGNWFGVAARQVTKDLEEKALVKAANTVTPRSYLGAAINWSPIYGKISLLNRSIVPFDLSFSFGGGTTTTDVKSGEPTVHVATSQNFAVSKSFSFRWDIMLNFYQATAIDKNGNSSKLAQNDFFIGLGLSWFFPEATYR